MTSFLHDSFASERSNSFSPLTAAARFEPRPVRVTMKAATLICMVTVLERCAYYTMTMNLVFTLERWFRYDGKSLSDCSDADSKSFGHIDTATTVVLLIALYMLSAMGCILGGWLGDSRLGRYKTLVWSFVMYIVGTSLYLLMVWASICDSLKDRKHVHPGDDGQQLCIHWILGKKEGDVVKWILLMSCFLFIALGYGLCKPNIAPFGADQIRGAGTEKLQFYYQVFYVLTNIGTIAAFGVSMMQTPASSAREYFLSFVVPPVCSVVCLALLLLGSREFITVQPAQDTFRTYFEILKELMYLYFRVSNQTIRQGRQTRIELLKTTGGVSWGAEEVDAFVNLTNLFPPLLTMLIYWTCYSQFQSMYYIQGFYLNDPDNGIPLSIVNVINPIMILFLVPLLNCFFPYLQRKRNLEMHAFTRMMIGYALAAISLCCAAILGTLERELTSPEWNPKPVHYYHEEDANSNYTTYIVGLPHANITWLLPQIFFITLSEVLAVIAGMEFVYIEAPPFLKSFAMGLFFLVTALGETLAIILLVVIKKASSAAHDYWICNNLNHGKIDNYFLFLASLMLLNMFIFFGVKYKPGIHRYSLGRGF